MRTTLRTTTLALVWLAWATTTLAQQRATAVVPFEGRGADAMRRRVVQVLAEHADVIEAGRVDAAAAERGVRGTGEDGVVALASDVGAALVVQGSIEGSARAPRLTLVIRAADATVLANEAIRRERGRAGSDAFDARIVAVYQGAAAAYAASLAAARQEEVEEPEPVAPPPDAAPSDGLPLFVATAGLSIRNREAGFALSMGGRRRYDSGTFGELVLSVEARPFANAAHLGRGLFATFDFAHSVGFTSVVDDRDPSTPDPAVATNFARFYAGAGWLAPLGDVAEAGGGAGFGLDGYWLGAGNGVLPTAEYSYLRFAARGRIRFYREAAVLEMEIAYRAILGIGQLVPDFGNAWGVEGFDIGIGMTGTLLAISDLGFFWGARFDYVGYWLRFAGPALDAPVSAGSDGSIRVTLRVGWSFR